MAVRTIDPPTIDRTASLVTNKLINRLQPLGTL